MSPRRTPRSIQVGQATKTSWPRELSPYPCDNTRSDRDRSAQTRLAPQSARHRVSKNRSICGPFFSLEPTWRVAYVAPRPYGRESNGLSHKPAQPLDGLVELAAVHCQTPAQELRRLIPEGSPGCQAEPTLHDQALAERQAVAQSGDAKEGIHATSRGRAQLDSRDRRQAVVETFLIRFDLLDELGDVRLALLEGCSGRCLYETRRARGVVFEQRAVARHQRFGDDGPS